VACAITDGAEHSGPLPEWATFLIGLGYRAICAKTDRRRIFLVSLPCDSQGAGLVTLGALRRRLEVLDANDLSSHFERIKNGVAQGGRATTLRRAGSRNARYQFDGVDKDGTLWLLEILSDSSRRSRKAPPRFPVRTSVTQTTATQWLFDGEAPLHVDTGDVLPWMSIYKSLPLMSGPIIDANLSTTDSAICLASRVSGDSATKSVFDSMSFSAEGVRATLSQLLTVQGWGGKAISRVSLFNSRTDKSDRPTANASVVIADGDGAFLKAISKSEFGACDIIGIINRAVDRDRLEAIGNKIEELRQWFEVDLSCTDAGKPPLGLSVVSLKARHK
jgi:hypothetical protein